MSAAVARPAAARSPALAGLRVIDFTRVLAGPRPPTGRRTSEALFADRVMRAYVPYDYPAAVSRFLDHFRPRLVERAFEIS